MRTNGKRNGFALVELVLIIVIIGLIAGTGYYVLITKTTSKEVTSSEKASDVATRNGADGSNKSCTYADNSQGTLVYGVRQQFRVCVPNGWKLGYTMDTNDLYSIADLQYDAGSPAVLEKVGGSDNNYPLWIHYGQKPSFSDEQLTPFIKVVPPTSDNRYDISKLYHRTTTDDPVGAGIDYLPAGTKQYLYVITTSKGVVQISYHIEPTQADQTSWVDKLAASIR